MEGVVDQLKAAMEDVVVLSFNGRSSWPDPMEEVVHISQWKSSWPEADGRSSWPAAMEEVDDQLQWKM